MRSFGYFNLIKILKYNKRSNKYMLNLECEEGLHIQDLFLWYKDFDLTEELVFHIIYNNKRIREEILIIKLGNYIKNCIKEEGRTISWVSEKLGINYKTFTTKLDRNTISADELLKISVLLGINLESLKSDLEYKFAITNEYAYVITEEKDINIDEILNMNRITVSKMRIAGSRGINSDEIYDSIYLFMPINSESGSIEYELRLVNNVHLKEEGGRGYMKKNSSEANRYILSKSKLYGNVNISNKAKSMLAGNINISNATK